MSRKSQVISAVVGVFTFILVAQLLHSLCGWWTLAVASGLLVGLEVGCLTLAPRRTWQVHVEVIKFVVNAYKDSEVVHQSMMLVQLIEGFVILAAFLILLAWLHNVTTYDPLMGILPRTLNSFMRHDAKFSEGFANFVVFMLSLSVGFVWMMDKVTKNSGRQRLKNIFLMPVLIPAWVTGTLIFIALLNFIWPYIQVMVINAGIGMIALGTLLLAVMIVLSVARLCSHHAFVAMTIGVALGGLSGLATAGWTGADFNALILELVVGGAVGGGLTYALGRLGETEFVSTRGFFLQHRES